jgi:hypothetical protein
VTIREKLAGQRSKAQLIALSGLALLALGGLAASTQHELWPLPVVGFVLFFGGTLYQSFGIRCPRCREAVGHVIMSSSGLFSVSAKFRFCPYCGVELDTQLDTMQKV